MPREFAVKKGEKTLKPQRFLSHCDGRLAHALCSIQKRRPGGVGSEGWSCNAPLVVTCKINSVEVRAALGARRLAEEHDHPPVRRPGRPLIMETFGEDA